MDLIELTETGVLPSPLIRLGIRRLLARRLRVITPVGSESRTRILNDFVQQLRNSPLAAATDKANEQHDEVPVEFSEHLLGPRLKYGCCLFATQQMSLEMAEAAMRWRACKARRQ